MAGVATAAIAAVFRAAHGVPMQLNSHAVGGLNLLFTGTTELSSARLTMAQLLADLATIGLTQESDARRMDRLAETTMAVMDGQVLLGHAIGLIVGALGIAPGKARTRLRRHSRITGSTVTELARALTGRSLDPRRAALIRSGLMAPDSGYRRDMDGDQFEQQNPVIQYEQPGSGDEPVAYPGLTADLDVLPDHGESTYRGTQRLVGKKTVITGGDSGIGRAVAIAFAREGADVLLSYLPEEQADAETTAELVRAEDRTAVLVPGDLREEQTCKRVIDEAVREFGRIDVLVSNAAYQMSQTDGIFGIDTEQFDRAYKTNVYALFWLCKHAVEHIPEGGSIITTSSVQAFSPSVHLVDYASTKAAIVNFTKALGANLVDRGIRVNSVAPGPIWTPLIPATMGREKLQDFGAQAPMKRAGQPAELAPIYVFLASQESSYITSEVIGVTGGSPIV